MRIRYVPVTADFLIGMMKSRESGRVRVVANQLPDDARIVRMGHDAFGLINIIVESATFEDVVDGEEIPMHPRTRFERVEDIYGPATTTPTTRQEAPSASPTGPTKRC